MNAVPTEKQFGSLRLLGGGYAGLSWTKRQTEPFLRRGWVTAEFDGSYYQWIRITADGLRAMAAYVDKHGLPAMGKKATFERKVCSECGTDWRPKCRCGSRSYRFDYQDVDVPDALVGAA